MDDYKFLLSIIKKGQIPVDNMNDELGDYNDEVYASNDEILKQGFSAVRDLLDERDINVWRKTILGALRQLEGREAKESKIEDLRNKMRMMEDKIAKAKA